MTLFYKILLLQKSLAFFLGRCFININEKLQSLFYMKYQMIKFITQKKILLPSAIAALLISPIVYSFAKKSRKDEFWHADVKQVQNYFNRYNEKVKTLSKDYFLWRQQYQVKKKQFYLKKEQTQKQVMNLFKQKIYERIEYSYGIYEGQVKMRGQQKIKHGVGKMQLRKDHYFQGNFRDGFPHGFVKVHYPSGIVQYSNYENGQINGIKIVKLPNGHSEQIEEIMGQSQVRTILYADDGSESFNIVQKKLDPKDPIILFLMTKDPNHKDFRFRFILKEGEEGQNDAKGIIFYYEDEKKIGQNQGQFYPLQGRKFAYLCCQGIGLYFKDGVYELNQMEKNAKKRAVSIFEDGRRVITMKDGKEVHEEVV